MRLSMAVMAVAAMAWLATGATGRPQAAAAPLPGRPTSPGVALVMSSLYDITVAAGAWDPVVVSVTNPGGATVQGEVMVRARSSFAPTGGCYADGPTTVTCPSSATFSYGAKPPVGPGPRGPTATEVYDVPVLLAPGTTKDFVVYLLAEPSKNAVTARLVSAGGHVLAAAHVVLGVADGPAAPAILVVTDQPAGSLVLNNISAPTGSAAQVQYLAPSQLPTMAAALGTFRAVAVDQADTSVLSAAQGTALDDYVRDGGTLVVAGAQGSLAATAGLPAGLLPARFTGAVAPKELPGLATLLGAPPLPAPVDVAALDPAPGSQAILSQAPMSHAPMSHAGAARRPGPLAVQARHGAGHVVLCTFDPSSPPLSTWPGTPHLLERLFAVAFQPGYYGTGLPYGEGGGVFPTASSNLVPSLVARLGTEYNAEAPLMSPATAAGEVAEYLDDVADPAQPPSAEVMGVVLLAYVTLVGPLCFLGLGAARRRHLMWVAVPAAAVVVSLAAVLAWTTTSPPQLAEARIAEFAPGGHVAQVASLGFVQLPNGGTRHLELTSPGTGPPPLVGSLPGGSEVTVVPGPVPSRVELTISGARWSAPGWAASEQARLAGTVQADVTISGDTIWGTVTDQLGVQLQDAEVVAAAGEAEQQLGTLAPGAAARFGLVVPPQNPPSAQAFGAPGPAAGSLRLEQLLSDLAATYSAQQGGSPMFVALAGPHLLPADAVANLRSAADLEVVLVPMASSSPRAGQALAGVPSELVGASGINGEPASGLTTTSLALGAGGCLYYQFLLPARAPGRLVLDLGSSSGSYDRSWVAPSAYDYATGSWARLRARAVDGDLVATVPSAPAYLSGGALEVAVRATAGPVEVYGAFPELSASPAHHVERVAIGEPKRA